PVSCGTPAAFGLTTLSYRTLLSGYSLSIPPFGADEQGEFFLFRKFLFYQSENFESLLRVLPAQGAR
ncbi:MAG: hypothetical protein ACLU5C_05300, partial [Acutalibacter sp.]